MSNTIPHQTDTIKAMGLWKTTAFVSGNMIGSGLFLLPASLAIYGSISLMGWLLSAVGALLLAGVFSRLSRRFPQSGGPYIFCNHAFGEFMGFQVAWSYWLSTWIANAAIVTAATSYLSFFFPILSQDRMMAFYASNVLLWLLTFINIRGVKESTTITAILTLLKITALIGLSCLFMFYFDINNIAPLKATAPHSEWHAILTCTSLTFFAFIGVETATVPAGNIKDPTKTIPRATYLGTSIAAVLFIFTTVAIMGLMPIEQLAGSTAPFVDACKLILGDNAAWVIAMIASVVTIGTLNGFVMLQGQVPYAAAKNNLLPELFAKVSKGDAPIAGLVISSICVSVLLFMTTDAAMLDQFTYIVLLSTFLVLIPFLYSCLADLKYLAADTNPRKMATMLSLCAFAYVIAAIIGSGAFVVMWGSVVLFMGLPFFVWMKKTG